MRPPPTCTMHPPTHTPTCIARTSVLKASCRPSYAPPRMSLAMWVIAASRSCQFLLKKARATYGPATSSRPSASLAVAPEWARARQQQGSQRKKLQV